MLSSRCPPTLLLVAGLLVALPTTSARAQPAVLPSAAPATPPPIGAPRLEYPTYVYAPSAGPPGAPQMFMLPEPPRKRIWYGWQTLIVLGSSTVGGLLTGIVGIATESPALAATGIGFGSGGFAFGGPIVHWSHGNIGKGFGALGLNFGMPLVGLGLGVGTACIFGGCGGHDELGNMAVGGLIGAGAALLGSWIIDVTVLSYSYEPIMPVGQAASRKAPTWTLVPDLKITREKRTFGFAGVF